MYQKPVLNAVPLSCELLKYNTLNTWASTKLEKSLRFILTILSILEHLELLYIFSNSWQECEFPCGKQLRRRIVYAYRYCVQIGIKIENFFIGNIFFGKIFLFSKSGKNICCIYFRTKTGNCFFTRPVGSI